jgi:hypothetical protein
MIKKFWDFINEGRKVSTIVKKISLDDCGALCITFKKGYTSHDPEHFVIPWRIGGYNVLHKWDKLSALPQAHCNKIIITPVESDQVDTVVKQIANMVAIDSYIFIPYNDGNELMKYINIDSRPERAEIRSSKIPK